MTAIVAAVPKENELSNAQTIVDLSSVGINGQVSRFKWNENVPAQYVLS